MDNTIPRDHIVAGNLLFYRTIVVIFLTIFPFSHLTLVAQDNDSSNWEKWYDILSDGTDDNVAWEDMHDTLEEMASSPFNINNCKRELLESLPFLNSQQVMDIMEYIHRYGPLKSENELVAVESLDYYRRRLLACFITFGDKSSPRSLSLKDIAKHGKNELLAYTSIPTYQREGDINGYHGYPYKHWLRYNFTYGNKLRIGIVASQDAGEPFFANCNTLGYDYYSPFFLLNDAGRLKQLAVGRYRVAFGMGLVINQGFYLGKTSALQAFSSPPGAAIKVHSSRSSDNWLQGTAATLDIGNNLKASLFLSYRKTDATLNDDGTVSTIVTSGYHRSTNEIEKKDNTSVSVAGMNLTWENNDFHAGFTAVGTHFDRLLSPNTQMTYRQIYPQGHDFLNVGIDYGYRRYPLLFKGETAINASGNLATVNTLTLSMSRMFSITFLHRFYSSRYHSFHSNAFSDGGKIQNERGAYLGMEWKPSYGKQINLYIDYAYFPWQRYQVSRPSRSFDACLTSNLRLGKWTLLSRYRMRRRQKDSFDDSTSDDKQLVWTVSHNARLGCQWDNGFFTSSSQIDATQYSYDETSRGILFSQTAGFNLKRVSLTASLKLFFTDDYDSRIYSHERSPLYCYSMPSFYGKGIRYAFMAKWKLIDSLTLTCKIGVTDFFDRSSIGSSFQQIDASSACDIDLQARWKF